MATPAAYLNIVVNAQTTKARTELKRFDRELKQGNRQREVEAKLGAVVDHKAFAVYNKELEISKRKAADRKAFKAALGADFDARAFNAYHKATQRAGKDTRQLSGAMSLLGGVANRTQRSLKRLAPNIEFTTRVPIYKIAAIGAAIAAIIPPTVALAGALGPLTGLLAAIPSLASAAGQAIGAIVLGARGVGDAIKASLDAQKTAAKDAGSTLKVQQTAAEGVRSAIRGVSDAQRGLADSHRGVADAERGLADAQRQTKSAQEDLNRARQDAARDLIDMRLAVQGAVLSEKEARVELSRTIQEQTRILGDEASTSLDIRDANLAVQRARLGLREATVEAGRAQKDFNEAQDKGISGSERVVSAQEALKDAQRGVADANRGVADANRGVVDAQRALVEATRQVRMAQRDQAQGAAEATAGMEKYQEAMQGLPVAAQDFVRFIVSLKPKIDELRDAAAGGLFPGVTQGIQSALGNLNVFKKVIGETATALGNLAARAGQQLGSMEWGRDLETQGERNVQIITRLGTASLNLADALRHITIAAGPMVSFLTRSAVQLSVLVEKWAQSGRESGRLEAFFQRTVVATKLTVEALWDFSRALINIGAIARKVWGQDLLKGINDAAESFRKWTESVRGSRDIEAFFIRWRARWVAITDAVEAVIDKYRTLREEGKSVSEALTTVFASAATKALVALANKVGEIAPKIALGFVRGFFEANVWGKLAIGAWLFAKLGGFRAAIPAGAKMAGGFWGGFSTAPGPGAGGVAGKFKGMAGALKTVGKTVLGVALIAGIADAVTRQGISGIGDRFQQFASAATFGLLPGPRDIDERMSKIVQQITTWRKKLKLSDPKDPDNSLIRKKDLDDFTSRQKQMLKGMVALRNRATALFGPGTRLLDESWANPNQALKMLDRLGAGLLKLNNTFDGVATNTRQVRKIVVNNLELIRQTMGFNTQSGADAVRKNMKAALRAIKDNLFMGRTTAVEAMKAIRQTAIVNSQAVKSTTEKNFKDARNAIRDAVDQGLLTSQKGLKEIRQLWRDQLKLYGYSPKDVTNIMKARKDRGKTRSTFGVQPQYQQGGLLAKGGMTVPGTGSGDKVHLQAMVEPGEKVFVLNRTASKQLGELQNLNTAMPRKQEGGLVGYQGGGLVSLGRQLQRQGYQVGEHPAFGGVAPGVHTPTSYHYKGQAIDVNWPDVSQEPARLDALFRRFKGMKGVVELLWRVADHFDHLHLAMSGKGGKLGDLAAGASPDLKRPVVGGPASALKGAVQGVIGTVHAAAESSLARVAAKVEGAEPGAGAMMSGSGPVEATFAKVARRLSKSKVATLALGMAGYAESGMRDLPGGHSTSQGALQLLSSTAAGLGVSPHDEEAVASLFFTRGFYGRGGANKLAAQGLPAHTVAQLVQGSGTGQPAGVQNYLPQERSARAWMSRYNLREGGFLAQMLRDGGALRSYPLGRKGKNLGGPGAHKARALGNWQSDNAVDIGVPIGTIVKAVVAGRMGGIKGSWDGGGGQTSGIQAYLGDQWWYTHLKQIDVKTGEALEAGQRIGVSGAGNSVPHLHLAKRSGNPEMALGWPIVTSGSGGVGPGGKPESKKKETAAERRARERAEKLKAKTQAPLTRKQLKLLKNLPKKPLPQHFRKVLSLIRKSKKPKLRDKALQGLLERIAGAEIIPNADHLAALQAQTTTYGDFAERANALSTGLDTQAFQNMTADQMRPFAEQHLASMTDRQRALFDLSGRSLGGLDDGALMEILDTPRWGQVGGKTQAEWLEVQLETLRVLRNALIDAERQVIARRQRVMDLIVEAQKRLAEVEAEIERAAQTKRRLGNALEAIERVSGGEAPAKARQIVRNLKGDIPDSTWKTLKEAVDSNRPAANLKGALKGEIREVVERQKPRKRERDALADHIIPALEVSRDAHTEALTGEILPSLLETQGSVADEIRTQVFSQLPELGVLGGQIFDVQMSLRDLGVKKILSVPQPEVSEAETESAELLRELLRQANLRTAVSQLQYDVFKNFPPFGGQFHTGGVVPGPLGAERMILAQGGEVVSPAGGGDVNVRLIFPPGMDWLQDKIRVEVEHVTRSQARGANRRLPGRGGGL